MQNLFLKNNNKGIFLWKTKEASIKEIFFFLKNN